MSAGSDANPTRNGAHVVTESYRNITMDSSTFGLAVDAPGGYRADVEYAVRISNNGEFVHARPVVGRPAGQQQRVARLHQPVHRPGRLVLQLLPARATSWRSRTPIGPTLSAADGDIYDWAVPWDHWQAGSALK